MRALITITLASVLTIATGCVSNVRDPRMTGGFRSQSGEAIVITPDQHAYVSYNGTGAGEMWWLGSIRVDPRKPREAFLLTDHAQNSANIILGESPGRSCCTDQKRGEQEQ